MWFTISEIPGRRFPWYGRITIALWHILRRYVYERDGGRCCYCGTEVELTSCHVHHVLELSEGGTNHPTNLKTLCVNCHKVRHPFMQTIADRVREEQ